VGIRRVERRGQLGNGGRARPPPGARHVRRDAIARREDPVVVASEATQLVANAHVGASGEGRRELWPPDCSPSAGEGRRRLLLFGSGVRAPELEIVRICSPLPCLHSFDEKQESGAALHRSYCSLPIILWQFPSLPKHMARAGCHSQLPNYN